VQAVRGDDSSGYPTGLRSQGSGPEDQFTCRSERCSFARGLPANRKLDFLQVEQGGKVASEFLRLCRAL
jgi:hypothetical protein